NFHGAVCDLAYFEFKQAPHEIRMAARYDNFRTPDPVFDRHHVCPKTIADIVIFHRDSLALGHHGFEFPKIENDIGTVEASHGSAHDFTRAILEFLVNHFLLGLADSLHHGLLCGLRRDAPEILRRDLDFYGIADVRVRVDLARLRELDFVL